MCGFVGHYSLNQSDQDRFRLKSAMDTIAHRGPDSHGTRFLQAGSGHLSLGFHRLAIVDLSDRSDQPFIGDSGRYSLVFNGEIYNYLELRNQLKLIGHNFRTNSDTEVLLAAWSEWGTDSIGKFIGMFSFVLTDHLNSEMYCVRDAFGIKPLYYHSGLTTFSFASEIRALRLLSGGGTTRNENVCKEYLITGRYDFGNETFFQGIENLLPGHLLKISLGNSSPRLQLERWWRPPIQSLSELSIEQATEKMREEFLASVRMHMRADVKIAAALSGGLDSSAIVGAIHYLEPQMEINTFSFVGGTGSGNERTWIETANRQFGAKQHLVFVQDSEFERDSDTLIELQGEPFGSTSIYAQYKVFQEAKKNGFKVLLDGQGADELFAGYFGYPESFLISKFESFDFIGALSFISKWGRLPGRKRIQLQSSIAKNLILMLNPLGLGEKLKQIRMPGFLLGGHASRLNSLDFLEDFDWKRKRLTQRLLLEQSIGALPSLLRHADRNSMSWSIESRVPFLTPNLATLGLGVSENFLLSESGITKDLLRRALNGIVSPELILRKDKVGFETPQDEWLKNIIVSKSEVLEGIRDFEYLDAPKTREFLLGKSDKNPYQNPLFWRTYNLVRWNQLHFNK
jgi:asparagine synthase (glutamine-hydrolysing)